MSNVIDIWQIVIVSFWGICVFRKKLLPKTEHPSKSMHLVDSPKNRDSYFEFKWIAVFRGCIRRPGRVRHVPKWANHLFWKQECSFSGHATEDFGPKRPKYLCACPFLGHSYFEFKWFTVFWTCNVLCIFITWRHA